MKDLHENLAQLYYVAERLGELREEVYFVGGAVNNLYTTSPISEPSRVTIDVDFVVNIFGYGKYVDFSERLKAKGFIEDSESKLICRWKCGPVLLKKLILLFKS